MWAATSGGHSVVAMATRRKPSYIGLEPVTLRRGGKNTKCNAMSRITSVVHFVRFPSMRLCKLTTQQF